MIALETLVADISAAAERIAPHVRETPLVRSDALSAELGSDVWLKLENLQITGSFKLRGAMNKLLSLSPEERARGVVAASSGNHGAAVARAAAILGIGAEVFVPSGASTVKVDAIVRSGATVQHFGVDGLDTEVHARSYAASGGKPYVSPYNDPDVVAGQGTVGVELRRQAERFDAVVVAVGGGGLISGIGADLKARAPETRVIGALPANSPVMSASIRAGRIVELESRPTLSDGTAGGIESGAITFELCRALVDAWVEVDEDEIATALRECLAREHLLVEGAAAAAIAGLRRIGASVRGARVAVVLCGANISAERLKAVL